MDCSVTVMSCDAYEDCWQPFFKLKEKYWSNCPYKTYLVSETKDCKYAETIKVKGEWTSRLRQALEKINSKYVIFLMEDYFIREYVDQERICKIIDNFKEDEAVYDFEYYFNDKTAGQHLLGFDRKINNTVYMNNCQPSIHDRLKLIERLQKDQSAWQWETTPIDSKYKFYINTSTWIIDVGHRRKNRGFGITRGKWTKECIEFLNKEEIEIDYSIRGKFEGIL